MSGPPPPARRVPPGKHELRREVVTHHQRERILRAVAEVIAAEGYSNVSVADIVKRAAIARAKFYENFSSKEDAFLGAYDGAVEEAHRRVSDACSADAPLAVRVTAGLSALLHLMDEEPELARMCIVEGPSAGPVGTARYEQAVKGFAPLLEPARDAAEESPELPATVEEAVIGGTVWLLYEALLADRSARLQDLLPQLVEFCLLPFIGAQAAGEAASLVDAVD